MKKMVKLELYVDLPEWFNESVEKINYLFPKSHGNGYMSMAFKIAWYKVHHEETFNKIAEGIKRANKLIEFRIK